jgi:hypothetical protein
MSTTKLSRAYVLCDVASHALKAGQIVEASPELVKALVADGSVDTAKAAVAYAAEQGAAVVRSAIELAAEQKAEAIANLQAEIAKAEAALKDATDEAVKAALLADLAANSAALQQLQA